MVGSQKEAIAPQTRTLPRCRLFCSNCQRQRTKLPPGLSPTLGCTLAGFQLCDLCRRHSQLNSGRPCPGGFSAVENQWPLLRGGRGSRPENLFVWSLISGMPNFWTTSSHAGKTDSVGRWIGLFQVRHQIKEPGGGWGWVSGEPFSYRNWAPGKPNNLEEIEDYGQYLIVQGSNDQATWIDLPNDSLRLTNKDRSRASRDLIRCWTSPLALMTIPLRQIRWPEFHLSF